MDLQTAKRLAKHPFIQSFRLEEPNVYQFRLIPGRYVYLDTNAIDGIPNSCFPTLVTGEEEEFVEAMATGIIDEAYRRENGLEIIDSSRADEALEQQLRWLARREKFLRAMRRAME